MTTDHLRSVLAAAIARHRLLEHPFYVRWSAGELSLDELRAYAGQYRHVEAATPAILRGVIAGSDDAAVRAEVERTLADEVGGGEQPSHLELFDRFAAGLEAPAAAATPATTHLVEALTAASETSTAAGLAALAVYELQSPDVSATKAAGLRRHYGLDDAAVLFWDTHATADLDHADWLVQALVDTGAGEDQVSVAAQTAAGAWWAFLDEREAAAA